MVIGARAGLAGCIFWLCGLAVPASAAVVADFNRDGVPDTATVVASAPPNIWLSISGTKPPLLLVLKEWPSSLVAADVDRDGLIDLAGVSAHHGLFVLKNRDGHRFTRLRARHHRSPFAVFIKRFTRRVQDDPLGSAPTAADPPADDQLIGGGAGGLPLGCPSPAATGVIPRDPAHVTDSASRPSHPRAPPSSAFAFIQTH
jgi:hypothetical protein